MLLQFDRLGWWRWVLVGITGLTVVYLLMPILFIAALSFGSSQWLIFPPPAWTTRWYGELFADPRWLESAWVSFVIACVVFSLTGLVLLQIHAAKRRSTWPIVGLGLAIPALIAIVFIH